MKNKLLLAVLTVLITSCSSQSVLPEKEDVKVSRNQPAKNCREIGKVLGNAISTKSTREDVLGDLKQEAANKGANYVVVLEYSDNGTSATGMAYQCP